MKKVKKTKKTKEKKKKKSSKSKKIDSSDDSSDKDQLVLSWPIASVEVRVQVSGMEGDSIYFQECEISERVWQIMQKGFERSQNCYAEESPEDLEISENVPGRS